MYTKSISAVTKNQNFQLKEIFTGIKHYRMPEDLSDSNSKLILEFKVWVCCGGGLLGGLVRGVFWGRGVLKILIWVFVLGFSFKVHWKRSRRSRGQEKKKNYFLF